MNALSPVAPRIAKLIPRLATNHDGEVVTTVRAIERTLKTSGLDFHDLAGALERAPQTRTVIVYRDREPSEPQTWHELAKWCGYHDNGRLKPHERDFVRDMADRLVCDGEPTERQGAWLRALYAKLRRECGR
jgi:hypothetical protein